MIRGSPSFATELAAVLMPALPIYLALSSMPRRRVKKQKTSINFPHRGENVPAASKVIRMTSRSN
jgi:hypothetical protein